MVFMRVRQFFEVGLVMGDKKYLLNDGAMQDFIVNGYLVVTPNLSPDFHQSIFQQTLAVIENDGNPGNNLLPKVPILQQIFDDPAVDGALTSILGPNYVMHQHRACHYHPPGSKEQNWHKDYPLGGNTHYHRTRLAMAFYYPQDVTEDMGPTAIQPGTQYYMTSVKDAIGLPICGEAGTVTIVHYGLWHRATENRSDKTRFMLKFLFCRTEEPQQPSWNTENLSWELHRAPAIQHQTLWRHLWKWHRGEQNGKMPARTSLSRGNVPGLIRALRDEDVNVRRNAADLLSCVDDSTQDVVFALLAAFHNEDEPVRLNAAYALATGGKAPIPALMAVLREESEAAWARNLSRNDYTNPSQLDSIFALAVAGESAVPGLIEGLNDANWWVRAAATTSLGCMGQPAHAAVPVLIKALKDESEWVCRNAADALGNIGQPAQIASPALVEALGDEREVSRWSLSASPFRENAAAALAKMAQLSQVAVPALTKALNDENEYIRSWATIALSKDASPGVRF